MVRPESGPAPARLFRWQLLPVTQEFQHELALEPLSLLDGAVLRPVGGTRGKLGRWHRGVDLAAPVGTPVRLALSGVVTIPPFDAAGFGNSVLCEGARYRTTYGHLSVIRVMPGTRQVHGDLVALTGSTGNSTGPHLHWEVWDKELGAWIDPWTLV